MTLASFARHLFLCTNQREPGSARGCCSPDGKGDLQKLFKDTIGSAGLKATVRANKAGCPDQCEHGPTVVIYPEAVWYGFVQPADVAEIVREHVAHGRPVDCIFLCRCRASGKANVAFLYGKATPTGFLIPSAAGKMHCAAPPGRGMLEHCILPA